MELHSLENRDRPFKRRKRVGRGIGSGRGKTCCRGHKGAGARAGWKSRARYEGGQLPLYRKLPTRGFNNSRFQQRFDTVNLGQIQEMFSDGDVVNLQTLHDVGFLSGPSYGVKLLGNGELTKKVTIEVSALSKQAEEKLNNAKISYAII